ncbi:excalibur calcium-binding domain-containing protein [Peribacillus frigoritolerans]|uniref:excalibur calcium-binding domain-containing protein n=1 Tax=Peribacillus frigoritolerans TaxID=450367 RepID=UPI0025A22F4F|nr:excalibur calcium-binding domain-containing protein [Peribacillus frigoritolerans]MDM5309704.1 excalibur calcium-binding domain-containing protein [Peribacillus frigoritolerans]
MKKLISIVAATTLITSGIGTLAPNQADATSGIYKNCTTFNKKYTKGVAKSANTKNKVINRTTKKVSYKPLSKGTKISSKIYKDAIKKNEDLDRDNDGIACEK